MLVDNFVPDIYLLVGDTYLSNSTVFVRKDEVLLVDAMASASDSERLRDFVELELRKRVRFIICTHYFSDHLAALRLFPEAQVIAHRNYGQTFASEKHRTAEEEAHFVEPDVLISEVLTIRWGRHTLEVFHNPGHTMSTLSIDVPEADLVMTADNVVGSIAYLFYSTPEMLTLALQRLQSRGRSRLIGSHMGVRGGEAVGYALTYLDRLGDRVRSARRSSANEDTVLEIELENCLAPGVQGKEFERMFHRRNLETIAGRHLFGSV
jgi:glyoxylase-like metal-dependent hydrolase (beta-lactamase superfamily II)